MLKQKKIEKACSVKVGESRNDFVSRCVKEQMDKGKSQDEALGMCEGMFNEAKKSEALNKELFRVVQSIRKSMIDIIKICKQK